MKNWFVFEDDESLSKDSRLQKRKQKLFTGSEVSLIQLQDKATTLKELNLFFDKVPVTFFPSKIAKIKVWFFCY